MAGGNKDVDILNNLYMTQGKSIPDVASELGISYSRARKALIVAGIPLRSRAEGLRSVRAKLGGGLRGKKRVFSSQWRANISKGRLDWGAKNAVGVSLKPNGYIEITRGENKGRSVHDVLMERRIGRGLRQDEVVHHIDGDRSNNDPHNLSLMTRAGHSALHRKIEQQKGRAQNGRFA